MTNILDHFAPDLVNEFNLLDISSVMATTEDYESRRRWSQLLKEPDFVINDYEESNGTATREKLKMGKAFIIKLMLLSAPIMAYRDNETSLFERLFNFTR